MSMTMSAPTNADARDAGFVEPIQVLFMMVVVLASVVFLSYLGRLASAGIQLTNAAQDAARAASLTDGIDAADAAADSAVSRSGLPARCVGNATADATWRPSELGTWQGGTVTVLVTCTVANSSLSGIWSPGTRTLTATDTQIIERFRR